MDKIILFSLIGLVGWWIGNMVGHVGYEQVFDSEPSWLDRIAGIVGSSASSYLFFTPYGTR